MLGQVLAGFRAHTRQNVKHAVRHVRFGVDFRQFQGGKRRYFARLEDHRVARRQRRGGFPQGDLDRIVPRADARHHAQRLAAGIDEGGLAQRDLAAFQCRDQPRVVLQHVRAGDDVDGRGFRKRFTGVEGFQLCQLVVALAQDIDGATQDARALHGGHRRPDFLPALCAIHGAVHVFTPGGLHARQNFTVGRVDGLEGATAGGGCITTIDIKLLFCHSGHASSSVIRSVNAG